MRWILILVISFSNNGFSQKIVRLYQEYQNYVTNDDYKNAVLTLKKIKRKAVTKNYYHSRIIYFSHQGDDSVTFYD